MATPRGVRTGLLRTPGRPASGRAIMSTIIKKSVDKSWRHWQHRPRLMRSGGDRMGRLTTHVLDTAHGRPGAGITVTVHRLGAGGARLEIARAVTNADGRTDRPILEGDTFIPGVYEIVFAAGDYFERGGAKLPRPPFVGDVVLRFGVANAAEHYHVPLLVSPWSYQTYRGS